MISDGLMCDDERPGATDVAAVVTAFVKAGVRAQHHGRGLDFSSVCAFRQDRS